MHVVTRMPRPGTSTFRPASNPLVMLSTQRNTQTNATTLITIAVRDARSVADARRVAKTIANSPLVKTAVHGADPNWGRIVAAAGRAGVSFDVGRATVRVCGVLLFENGLPHDDNAPQAAEHMKLKDVAIDVHLGTGGGGDATVWTCDLSAEYVKINGEYRT